MKRFIITQSLCLSQFMLRQFYREKMFVEKYFVQSLKDGRFVVDWRCLANDVLRDAKGDDEKWAIILLRSLDEECYDMKIYAEWHHLLPLCMRGSVLDFRNYVRIQPGLHLLVHAALCHFFPSYNHEAHE